MQIGVWDAMRWQCNLRCLAVRIWHQIVTAHTLCSLHDRIQFLENIWLLWNNFSERPSEPICPILYCFIVILLGYQVLLRFTSVFLLARTWPNLSRSVEGAQVLYKPVLRCNDVQKLTLEQNCNSWDTLEHQNSVLQSEQMCGGDFNRSTWQRFFDCKDTEHRLP